MVQHGRVSVPGLALQQGFPCTTRMLPQLEQALRRQCTTGIIMHNSLAFQFDRKESKQLWRLSGERQGQLLWTWKVSEGQTGTWLAIDRMRESNEIYIKYTSKELQTLQTCRCYKVCVYPSKLCNAIIDKNCPLLPLSQRMMWFVGFMKLPQSPDACNGTTLPDAYASGYGASIPDAGQLRQRWFTSATLAQKICCAIVNYVECFCMFCRINFLWSIFQYLSACKPFAFDY